MHNPAVAVGLWNAAWRLTVTGGVGGLVWQSVQACCGNVRGFAEFEAWWQTSHLPATLMCAECGNFTAAIVGPLRVTGAAGGSWENALLNRMINSKSPSSVGDVLVCSTSPPGRSNLDGAL